MYIGIMSSMFLFTYLTHLTHKSISKISSVQQDLFKSNHSSVIKYFFHVSVELHILKFTYSQQNYPLSV